MTNHNLQTHKRWAILPATILIIALLVRNLYFGDLYSVNVFYMDQWDFWIHMFNDESGFWDMFNHQHGPHKMGIGYAPLYLVAVWSDWNLRAESLSLIMITVGTTLVFLWLKFRMFKRWHYLDLLIPLATMSFAHYAIYYRATNPSLNVIPLLLVALIALSLTAKNDLLRFTSLVVLGFLSTYTGFAIFAAPILLLYFVIEIVRSFLYEEYRHRRWIASTALLLLGVGFASFFYEYKFQPSAPGFRFPHDPAWGYVVFIAKYWAHFFDLGRYHGFAFLVALVVTILFVLALWKYFSLFNSEDLEQRTKICVITFLMLFSVAFSLNLAVGRISLGIDQGMNSRYSIFMVPFWIACYFLLLEKQRLTGILSASILSILIFYGDQSFQKNSASELEKLTEDKHNWTAAYLEYRDIRKANEASNFKVYPWDWNYDLQEGFIDKMEKEGLGFLKENK